MKPNSKSSHLVNETASSSSSMKINEDNKDGCTSDKEKRMVDKKNE